MEVNKKQHYIVVRANCFCYFLKSWKRKFLSYLQAGCTLHSKCHSSKELSYDKNTMCNETTYENFYKYKKVTEIKHTHLLFGQHILPKGSKLFHYTLRLSAFQGSPESDSQASYTFHHPFQWWHTTMKNQ